MQISKKMYNQIFFNRKQMMKEKKYEKYDRKSFLKRITRRKSTEWKHVTDSCSVKVIPCSIVNAVYFQLYRMIKKTMKCYCGPRKEGNIVIP